jgi:flagellar biosynthesis protein FlhF
MEIRTYRAPSVHEALQMVRADLGPDAVVLSTRQVRAGGLLSLLKGERCLEVMASIDDHVVGRWPLAPGRLDRGIDLCETAAMESFDSDADSDAEIDTDLEAE